MRAWLAIGPWPGVTTYLAACDGGRPALGTSSRATTDRCDPQHDGQFEDLDQRITFLFSSAVLPDGGTFGSISLNRRCRAPLSKGGNPCVRS